MIIKYIIKRIAHYKFYSLISVCLLFLPFNPAYSSFELHGYGAHARGMGSAFVGLANSPDAIFLNSGGTAQLTSPAFSFFYTRPFGIKELDYLSFSGAFPTKFGTIASGCTIFGNKLYQEQDIILNFSQSYDQKIFYGINLHYMKLQINDYGSDVSYKIDIGFLSKITSSLNWGFFATNINRAHMGQKKDYVPQSFVTGLSLKPLDDTILNIDIYKELPFPIEVRAGIEYLLFDRIAVRTGFTTEPSTFNAGLGFNFKNMTCDYAVTTHQDLGLTHHFSFQINL